MHRPLHYIARCRCSLGAWQQRECREEGQWSALGDGTSGASSDKHDEACQVVHRFAVRMVVWLVRHKVGRIEVEIEVEIEIEI